MKLYHSIHGNNETISLKHEYKRPTLTSRCDVISDVINVKSTFSGIISDDLSIWLCTSNSVFLRVVVTKCVIWMVAMATKQHFEHCRTCSQLKAQQSLHLDSTISTTSWNYIFLEQDGFEVVIWCVGWCVKKNESSKVRFYKRKSILPKIQSIECRSFFICCCPRAARQNDTSG